MFSQSPSASSSPDILGPPGDAEYLISSPIRPFSGRQSFMSPANFKLLQTHRTGKGKRSRINLSPTKSAHSIRFDDVLLPASPSKKLNRRQRSLSPDKTTQGDGNLSPWRIRVTLEATQDEELDQGSPSRKRLKPSTTTTTRIPLKDVEDHAQQTPRRRRGRPRKSDIREQEVIPTTGSPGHTPGPGGVSGQKRKRGRPRKHPLNQDEADGGQPATDHHAAGPVEPEPEERWSPLNLAGDADSDDDALPEGFMPVDTFENGGNVERPDVTAWDQSSPRISHERTYETPDVTTLDQIYEQNPDEDPQSTPSKMPSPSRESRIFSPENTLHAGHTPRPPRSYPSPTSSSLGDDDRPDQLEAGVPITEVGHDHNTIRTTNDPTNEHREFDSIIESEGFSMVSLNTLPSVKQHGLSINSQTAKGALKPFLDRENIAIGERSKRKVSTLNLNHRQNLPDSAIELGPTSTEDPAAYAPMQTIERQQRPSFGGVPKFTKQNQPTPGVSPPPPSSARTVKQKTPLIRLASIIRAGLALEGALRRPYEGAPVPTPGTPDLREQIYSLEGPRRRLELLFSDFNPRIRRELRAGLGLAQELAKRRRKAEIEEARRRISVEASLRGKRETVPTAPPQQEMERSPVKDTPSAEMKRRLEEWQREREAVSREIQMANASQVIVLDSDTTDPPNPDVDANGYELGNEPDEDSDLGEGPHPEVGVDDAGEMYDEEDDEEEYEDIWQQEARDYSNLSHRSSTLYRKGNEAERQESSSSKSGLTNATSEHRGVFSPSPWTADNDKVPFLGHSRVKRLREQTVDLSTVLRGHETPRHIRHYYGQNSPARSANEQSPKQQRLNPESPKDSEGYGLEEEDHLSDIYLESSPDRASEDDTFQIDPTTRHESERQRAGQNVEERGDDNIPATALADHPFVHEDNSLTPARTRSAGGDGQASSWFPKITDFTPGWLKAPNGRSIEPASDPASEDVLEEEENEEVQDIGSTRDARTRLDDQEYAEDLGEPTRQLQSIERDDDQESPPGPDTARPVEDAHTSLQEDAIAERYESHFPLSLSGYFTDDHYILLRRLYRLAKQHPELFPYYPAPGRSDIIGDWIWTSDGSHGVCVTETQFAIIDRFVQELVRGDLQAGGTGQMGWSEADMHRRLISIIIGERIREEMKDEMRDEGSMDERMSGRDASPTTWRR